MIPRILSLLLIFISAVSSLYAQDKAYARNIVKELCAEDMNGRGYVDEGMELAAEFLAAEFRKIGLSPLFGEQQFLQSLAVPVVAYPGRMEVRLDGNKLEPGVDFHVYPGSPSIKAKGVVSGGQDGDILLVDQRDGGKPTELAEAMSAIMSSTGSPVIQLTDQKLTWALRQEYQARGGVIIQMSPETPTPESAKIRVDAEHYSDYRVYNVAAKIQGKSDSIILITAHYDHLGRMGHRRKSGAYFPGANDNASGTALMLDLARYYMAQDEQPEYTLVFIAFGAEELGLMGSSYLVEHAPFALESIRFQVNLDICGTGDDGIQVVNGSVLRPEFDRLVAINDHFALLEKVKIRGERCNSDHCPFYLRGVPAFFIYTLGGARHYHDVYDTEEALTLSEFEDLHRLLTHFIDGF